MAKDHQRLAAEAFHTCVSNPDLSGYDLGALLSTPQITALQSSRIFEHPQAASIPRDSINQAISQAIERDNPETVTAIALGIVKCGITLGKDRNPYSDHLAIHALLHYVPVASMPALMDLMTPMNISPYTIRSIMDKAQENHDPERASVFMDKALLWPSRDCLLAYAPVDRIKELMSKSQYPVMVVEALQEARRLGKDENVAAIIKHQKKANSSVPGNIFTEQRKHILAATPTHQVRGEFSPHDLVANIIHALGPEGQHHHQKDFPQFVDEVVGHVLRNKQLQSVLAYVFESDHIPPSFTEHVRDYTIIKHLDSLETQGKWKRLEAIANEMVRLDYLGSGLPYLETAKVIGYLSPLHVHDSGDYNDYQYIDRVMVHARKQKDGVREQAILEALAADPELLGGCGQYIICKYGTDAQLRQHITVDRLHAMDNNDDGVAEILDHAAEAHDRPRIDYIIHTASAHAESPQETDSVYPALVKHATMEQLPALLRYDDVTPKMLEEFIIHALSARDQTKADYLRALSDSKINALGTDFDRRAQWADIINIRARKRDDDKAAVFDLNRTETNPALRLKLAPYFFKDAPFSNSGGMQTLLHLAATPKAFISTIVTPGVRRAVDNIHQLYSRYQLTSHQVTDIAVIRRLEVFRNKANNILTIHHKRQANETLTAAEASEQVLTTPKEHQVMQLFSSVWSITDMLVKIGSFLSGRNETHLVSSLQKLTPPQPIAPLPSRAIKVDSNWRVRVSIEVVGDDVPPTRKRGRSEPRSPSSQTAARESRTV